MSSRGRVGVERASARLAACKKEENSVGVGGDRVARKARTPRGRDWPQGGKGASTELSMGKELEHRLLP